MYESRTQQILGGPSYDPHAHYGRIVEKFCNHPLNTDELAQEHGFALLKRVVSQPIVGRIPNDAIIASLQNIIAQLFVDNFIYVEAPPEFTEALASQEILLELEARYDASRVGPATETLEKVLARLLSVAPDSAFSTDSAASECALVDLFPSTGTFITYALGTLSTTTTSEGRRLFPSLYGVYQTNIAVASGCTVDRVDSAELTWPEDSPLHGQRLVEAYLKNTPFLEFFLARVPLNVPENIRFEHTHIVGGSGAGKTTLIQQMVLDNLASDDPPAMVIIDPKGLMIERIQKLAVFEPDCGRLKDRLVIIDPTHSPPPALNMFHPASKWNRMYSEGVRRQIENQAISNFAYVFSSVGSKLTDKQSVPFTFLVRLLFTVPNATILTLLELLDDPAQELADSKFSPHIGRLDAITRGFFANEYYERNFASTRKEIKARLYSILMRPEFVDMFSSPERKLDMFDCIQSKKIIVVNTAMSAMGSESSALLGRYIITLTLNAVFERIAIPAAHWNPAYLIIDEFQEFADEQKTPELLRLAREYNLGVVLAHQQMHSGELNESLRNAISTNTSIKYAAAVEGVDLSYVARDLRCDQSFLMSQRRTASHAQFACFVRNFTDHAVSVSVPLGNIQAQPEMSRAAHQELLRRNGAALTATPTAGASSTARSGTREPNVAPPEGSPRVPSPPDIPEAGSTW